MADAGYSWHIGTLRDGRITTVLPVVDGQSSWQVVLDDADTLSCAAALADPTVKALNLRTAAQPCRCFLAVAYTDEQGTETFLAGGPIWQHGYQRSTRQLKISAAGMWSLFDHRKVLPVLAAGVNPATASSTYTASLGTIAKQLVQLAQSHTGGQVPIVLPADEAGTNTRTYLGYDMTSIGQALRDLTQVQGGPEIAFAPRRSQTDPRYLEWVMQVGTTEQPLLVQAGDDLILDTTAARGSVADVNVNIDGSAMADRIWVQGAGTDVSTLYARADDTGLISNGFPLLELTDTNHSGEAGASLQATIDAYAAADLAFYDRPVETWTLTVERDRVKGQDGQPVGPNVASYRPGYWLQTSANGDEYIPDGTYRTRIMSMSGVDSPAVQLALAPTPGSV